MGKKPGDEKQRVGIVGGGRIGLLMFDLFNQSQLSEVTFVVDINPTAPAISAAKKEKVSTFVDIEEALAYQSPDFLVEVTGSSKVESMLEAVAAEHSIRLISHEMAYVLIKAIEDNNERAKNEILGIKSNISASLKQVEGLAESINNILFELKILTLNAQIEAAKAGEAGLGFAVVAAQMRESVSSIYGINQEIEKVNNRILSISNNIDNSLKKLQ